MNDATLRPLFPRSPRSTPFTVGRYTRCRGLQDGYIYRCQFLHTANVYPVRCYPIAIAGIWNPLLITLRCCRRHARTHTFLTDLYPVRGWTTAQLPDLTFCPFALLYAACHFPRAFVATPVTFPVGYVVELPFTDWFSFTQLRYGYLPTVTGRPCRIVTPFGRDYGCVWTFVVGRNLRFCR